MHSWVWALMSFVLIWSLLAFSSAEKGKRSLFIRLMVTTCTGGNKLVSRFIKVQDDDSQATVEGIMMHIH